MDSRDFFPALKMSSARIWIYLGYSVIEYSFNEGLLYNFEEVRDTKHPRLSIQLFIVSAESQTLKATKENLHVHNERTSTVHILHALHYRLFSLYLHFSHSPKSLMFMYKPRTDFSRFWGVSWPLSHPFSKQLQVPTIRFFDSRKHGSLGFSLVSMRERLAGY